MDSHQFFFRNCFTAELNKDLHSYLLISCYKHSVFRARQGKKKRKKSNQEMLGENLLKEMIALGSLGAALLVQAQPISVKKVTNVEITDSVRGGYIAGIVVLSIAAAVLLGIVIVLAYSNSRVYKADSDEEEDEEEFTHMGPGQGEHDEEEEDEEGEEAEGEGEEAEETQ